MAANLNGNTQSYQPFAIRIFQGLKPDVVAIQEFNYSNNTPADFRAMVDAAFGTNFSYFRENYDASGDIPNGVISRYPIVASGSWVDTVQATPNRGYAWARIDLPGSNDLYLVSVHLLTSSSSARAGEAANLKSLIQASFPSNAWVVVAGDLNTDSRSEGALATFKTFLSDDPVATDAEAGGNPNTNEPRSKPYDYVLPSFALASLGTNVTFASHSFSNGLVFDSRVYLPISDVAPVQSTDSGLAQHMAVVKDFSLDDLSAGAPVIVVQPQSLAVNPGESATFTVTASGAAPLYYHWRFDGSEITNAGDSSLTLTNVQLADAGDYSVLVSNSFGQVLSSNAALSVGSPPVITVQPQSQTVMAGQSATFTVTASGAAPLHYQWRFNGTHLADAAMNTYTRTNVQAGDAGDYAVVITNEAGAVTSVTAVLTVSAQPPGVIAQWNFNSPTPDTNTTTGTTTSSVGTGTAALVGGTSQTFATGGPTDPAAAGTDNSAWNTSSYPTQGTGNKSAGVRFNVSTAGKENIVIRWDQRDSSTGSKYVRLQYSTNGTSFADFPTATSVASANYELKTNSLSGLPGVSDNPNFAFRIVAEFESTAAGTTNANYVGAVSSYGTGGTVRFDMVTVAGSAISDSTPPARPVFVAPVYIGGTQFQSTVWGTAGTNYVIQGAADPGTSNWVSLQTNRAPFTFTDTNVNAFPLRFYRALIAP